MPRLNENEQMIADSAKSFFDSIGGTARARAATPVLDRAVWKQMAELGWSGMLVPEAADGLGMSARDAVVLLETAGAAIPPEPLSAVLGVSSALSGGLLGNTSGVIVGLISGEKVYVPVAGGDIALAGGSIAGVSAYARDLTLADGFLVLAQDSGDDALLLVPADGAGVAIDSMATIDGGAVGRLVLTSVDAKAVTILGKGEAARSAFRQATDMRDLCDAAMLVGLSWAAFNLAVAYMKERKQFGRTIGSFQALQHRAASVHVALSGARAFVYEVSRAADTPKQSFAWAGAKRHAADVALHACRESIQFFGAIGFADEHDVGLYFRKALGLAASVHTQAPVLAVRAGAAPARS